MAHIVETKQACIKLVFIVLKGVYSTRYFSPELTQDQQ